MAAQFDARSACACDGGSLHPAEAVNLAWIASALGRAGIDHRWAEARGLHVSGFGFPAWVTVDHEAGSVQALSQCDGADGLDDAEALRFANHCNETYLSVQFVWSQGIGRLYGHLALASADGLSQKQLLRSLSRFGSIFARAVAEGAACGVLSPPVVQY